MSYRITSLVVRGYTGPRKALPVLMALADYADDAGIAWPSVESLGQRSRRQPRQTRKHLTTLERLGWISLVGTRKGGRALASRWQINVARLKAKPVAEPCADAQNPAPECRLSPVDSDAETRHSATLNPALRDPKPGTLVPPKQLEAIKKRSERGSDRPAEPKRRRSTKPRALSLSQALEKDSELPTRCLQEAPAVRSDLTPEQVASDFASFTDHFVSKGNDTRTDWVATWRKWHRGYNPEKRTQTDKRANAAAQMHASYDAICGRTPAHPSHRVFDSTATTIDPPAEPPGPPPQIVVDLAAKFTGNAAPAAPAIPPADAGTTPEEPEMHNDPKRTTPPINLSAILNKRMPGPPKTPADLEAEKARQLALVAELQAKRAQQ